MTRRGLARTLLGALAWIGMGSSARASVPRRYGPMDVQTHRRWSARGIHLHVYHRGVEVTNRCRFADDTGAGRAELYLHDANGRPYLEPESGPWMERRVAMEIVRGIEVREGAPFR